jgi:hypothetical protein
MSKFLKLFLFLTFGLNCQGQKIIGNWEFLNAECSELLVINQNGTYKIFNDCYAENSHNPIIESGKWTINNDETKLYLINRNLKGGNGYKVWNNNKSLSLEISIYNNILKIKFLNKIEKWKKKI